MWKFCNNYDFIVRVLMMTVHVGSLTWDKNFHLVPIITYTLLKFINILLSWLNYVSTANKSYCIFCCKSCKSSLDTCMVESSAYMSVPLFIMQGFQSGPVPGTFTHLRSCIVPVEITEPPKISGGQNHKYDGR
jgi:hypothetical protein